MDLQEAFDVGFEEVKRYVDDMESRFERRLLTLEQRQPEKGDKGEPGQHGKDGVTVTIDDVTPMIQSEIAKAIEAIPTPNDGKDGRDGLNGKDGKDGKDGISISAGFLQQDGSLVLVGSDGTTREVGIVVGKDGLDGVNGKDGEPGKPGRDGFSLKDFDTELLSDGRTLLLKFGSGDIMETHEIVFPTVIDRGVWKDVDGYAQGDGVTWGGSFWIAQRDAKPGEKPEASDAWRLAVKRGRDGRDGKNGDPGQRGPEGKPGRNGIGV